MSVIILYYFRFIHFPVSKVSLISGNVKGGAIS